MKLCLATLALAQAAKNGKGGKHGNRNIQNDRYVWQTPSCLSNPDLCTKEETFTKSAGKIVLNQDNYNNFENSIYYIQVPEGKTIHLQFDQDGFGLEWHNMCGYDKLHIFRGNRDNFEKTNRIARFCGPKGDSGKPFDGSGKLMAIGDVQPMWDTSVDAQSNEVIVAVDLDQDYNGYAGFTLKWDAKWVEQPDYSEITELMDWAEETFLDRVLLMEWKRTHRGITKHAESLFRKMNRRIRKNKRCNTQNFPGVISSDVEAAFEGLYNSMANECLAYDIIRSMNSVLNLYQGQCRNASRWTNRVNNLVKKMDRKKRGDLQC